MEVTLIVAINPQGIIGKGNQIPWFYRGDLKFFKEQTLGGVVIMGRKTWESLPLKMRPLPDRKNVIVTSKVWSDFFLGPVEDNGVVLVDSVRRGIEWAKTYHADKAIWLMGGAEVYREGLEVAGKALVTDVPDMVEDVTDAVFWPGFTAAWTQTKTDPHPHCPDLSVTTWSEGYLVDE